MSRGIQIQLAVPQDNIDIYYTLDGREPTPVNAISYSHAIQLRPDNAWSHSCPRSRPFWLGVMFLLGQL